MKITYKCGCMSRERELEVTDRVPGSDIGEWMRMVVAPSVSYDHRSRNALCQRPKLDYLKLPVEDGHEVGVKPTRN